jgi:eukaryotic-like serine/threonine-protein kinase
VTNNDEDILADLLLRWEELREKGRETSAEELCNDYPHLLDEFARRIKILNVTSWLDQPLSDDGDPSVPPTQQSIPKTLIGRYRLDALIAEGGFAQVWRGYDAELQRIVAVKIPKPNRLQSADAFMAEARRVARLKHPGIVQVYDVGRDGELCFIVSEFIEGGSLADHLVKNPPTQQQVIRWIVEIAEALDYAHLHGVIHRDIKPANILIDHHGRALLADFGIAQSANRAGQEALSLGTLRYMSPEQLEGRDVDPRSDIFSLGIVLHEVLTGKLPYSSPDPNVLRREIVAGVQNIVQMPSDVGAVCKKALNRDPIHRQTSGAQFGAELRKCLDRPTQKSPSWLWVILGVVAVIAGVAAWQNFQPKEKPKQPAKEPTGAIQLRPEAGTFLFEGKSRIITPLKSFAPCTLEALFRMTDNSHEQFIIGSDVPHNYGIGIGVNTFNPIAEWIRGGFYVKVPITLGRWTHLAAVYAPNETRLYLDGKKIDVGPATQPPTIETPFVVGNVGEKHSVMFFIGHVRCLRISRGERYSDDFQPEQSITGDPDGFSARAVLIYDGSRTEGDRVIDLSGNGNDGRWEGNED